MAIPSVAAPATRPGRARAGAARIEGAIAILAVALMLGVAFASGGAAGNHLATRTTVHVRPGDTLWEIAAAHRAPGKTTAQTVELIAELNRLETELIEAGTALTVPAPVPDPGAMAMR